MGRVCERGERIRRVPQKLMTCWYVYTYIHVQARMYAYIYIYSRFHSARLWSPGSDGRDNLWRDARQQVGLKPQRFSTSLREDLRCYIPPSSSNIIDFNSASEFREVYRLKRETRSNCARIRIQFCRLPKSWNCYPSRGIYRAQRYNSHFFFRERSCPYMEIYWESKDLQSTRTLIFY